MKKLTALITLMFLLTNVNAQNKKDTVLYDTVITSYNYIVILDSAGYVALKQFIGSIPPSANKMSGLILNMIDGTERNVIKQPVFGLKKRNKNK